MSTAALKRSRTVPPQFDLHNVERALEVNHRLFKGKPLTKLQIRQGISLYRQFLADHKAAGMPEKFAVPSLVVDRVWHTHMCETEQYAQDCQKYFGQMFNHSSNLCNGNGDPEGD